MNSKGFSIAALVCGIIAVVMALFIQILSLILGILGIVFGVIGMKKAKEAGEGKGLAVAGLVLGIIGTAFAVIVGICVMVASTCIGASLFNEHKDLFDNEALRNFNSSLLG